MSDTKKFLWVVGGAGVFLLTGAFVRVMGGSVEGFILAFLGIQSALRIIDLHPKKDS